MIHESDSPKKQGFRFKVHGTEGFICWPGESKVWLASAVRVRLHSCTHPGVTGHRADVPFHDSPTRHHTSFRAHHRRPTTDVGKRRHGSHVSQPSSSKHTSTPLPAHAQDAFSILTLPYESRPMTGPRTRAQEDCLDRSGARSVAGQRTVLGNLEEVTLAFVLGDDCKSKGAVRQDSSPARRGWRFLDRSARTWSRLLHKLKPVVVRSVVERVSKRSDTVRTAKPNKREVVEHAPVWCMCALKCPDELESFVPGRVMNHLL
jgi:hypothetical protein